MEIVNTPTGKLGHLCPDGCANAQLFMSDNGLMCPKCKQTFPEAKVIDESEPPKRKKSKGE